MHEVISRSEAKKLGLKHYFTGKECPAGHLSKRLVSSYGCMQCGADWVAKERATNPVFLDRQRTISRENNRRRYQEDPEFRAKSKARSYSGWKRRFNTPEGKAQAYAWSKDWRAQNPEKVREMGAAYRRNNPEKMAIAYAVRASVKRLGKIKSDSHIIEALGYSRSEFKQHMESLFVEGMTWENYGEWQIDHVRPVTLFIKDGNLNTLEIHALSNLQPLWAEENMAKGVKYSDPILGELGQMPST